MLSEGPRGPALLAKRSAKRAAAPAEEGPSLTALAIVRTETRTSNQRGEDRHLNLAERAEVRFRKRSYDVAVVNVSRHGAMIEAPIEPRIGERMQIRFEGLNRTDCTVRWIRGGRMGLEFAQETVVIAPAAVKELIVAGRREGERPALAHDRHQREPRQSLLWKAVLHWDHGTFKVRIRNISAEGAMLEGAGELPPESGIVLDLGDGGTVSGHVRWARSGQFGVRFDTRFDMRRLVRQAEPQEAVPAMMKPAYLESELQADSPWAAAWDRFTPGDLEEE
ncbi:MAG TPA: PilZ domain-containing protein [Allosphingosinicella sp.]|nr:PilZ domain-containing protein [Allosphingosinicella sp.]